MSSTKFIVGGALVVAAFVGTIPLFFKDHKQVSKDEVAIASAPTKEAGNLMAEDSLLGTYNSKPLKYSDLSTQERQAIFEAQNQLFSTIESALGKHFIDEKMKAFMSEKKLSDMQVAEKSFIQEKVNVTDTQVKDFVKKNAENPQLKNKTPEQQNELVRQYLTQQAASGYLRDLVATASQEGAIKVTAVQKPTRPKLEIDIKDSYFKGPENAPITLVEFADFQCPYCYQALPKIQEILDTYKDKVKFVFKHFPLPFHNQAMSAAIATECAGKQGKYWGMHDAVFEKYATLANELYPTLAQKLGLNTGKFAECMQDPLIRSKVQKDLAYGNEIGVGGTPSFYVNGVQMSGGLSIAEFASLAEAELKKK